MSRHPSGHLTANAAPEPLPSRCSIAATAQSRHGWAAPAGSDRIWFRAAEEKNFTLRTARKTIEFAHARLFPCCKALPDALRRFVSPRGHRSRRRGSGLLPLPGGSGPRGPRAEIRPSDVLIYIQAPEMPYSMAMALSLLMYPVLKSLALQLHSAVTGSYIPGTHSIAFINCLNEQIAKDIARAIMDKKLAACVNILPKSSALYFWKGEIEESTEILLLVKTRTSKIGELSSYVRSIHPFEIPEIISLPIDQGNPLYFKWLEESIPRD